MEVRDLPLSHRGELVLLRALVLLRGLSPSGAIRAPGVRGSQARGLALQVAAEAAGACSFPRLGQLSDGGQALARILRQGESEHRVDVLALLEQPRPVIAW